MALNALRIENVEGGKALAVMNQELLRIIADVIERPFLTKGRSVTLSVDIVPHLETDPVSRQSRNYPLVSWEVKWSMPGRTGTENKTLEHDGELLVDTSQFMQLDIEDVPGVRGEKPKE